MVLSRILRQCNSLFKHIYAYSIAYRGINKKHISNYILFCVKRSWSYYLLIILLIEKIIQHCYVTVALYYNIGDIRSTVSVEFLWLMITGALVGVLFAFALISLLKKQMWSLPLIFILAVFDIIGEFIAQGRLSITVTISFIVAWLLILLVFIQMMRNKTLRKSF